MNEPIDPSKLAASATLIERTPTGTQSASDLRRRRFLVMGFNGAIYVVLAAWMAVILDAGGWTAVDTLMFAAFLIAAPWTVLGVSNSLIGLWLLHGTRDPMARVVPCDAAGDGNAPLLIQTAILMTLRNEDPARAFARLAAVKASVDAAGFGNRFGYFVLSDTSEPAIAAAEEQAFAAWKQNAGPAADIVYRRRTDNEGFKAGNVRDFCRTWGDAYELMLPLDADSLMAGATIVRLVRIMQAHPRLGILQSLVIGTPAKSAFARIFQFGMRHGMRAYTMGSAWWIGDCGPFWGHNAAVRIAPFRDHCDLPVLPGGPPLGGHVMSHDQVEATLMRRAGYEVRVLPNECASYEDNPPTLPEFTRRDLRWCLGNMQYLKLLGLKDLLPMSRFQLVWAILMFLSLPAWTLMIALSPLAVLEARAIPHYPAGLAAGLYVTFLVFYFSPKIAGLLDVLLTPGGPKRYGGLPRLLLAGFIECVFSLLQGAVSTFRTTLFMISLAFGRARIGWSGQQRDARGLSWTTAFAGLWPQLLFGLYVCGALAVLSPTVLLWSLPLTAGYLLAIPFAVVTASPRLGAFMERHKLCAVPEEFALPPEIRAVQAAATAR